MKPIDEMTDWEKEQAIYSARYILEDFFEMGKSGVELLAEKLVVVDGVVHSALENIFAAKISWQVACFEANSPHAWKNHL